MSTIFSPSACSWKPSNPWGKCFSHSKRKKRNRKRWTSSRDCSQRRSISPPQWELLVAHIHLFTFAFFKEVSCLSVISKFLCNFSQGTPLSKRASWLICMATFFFSKMEVFHLPGFLLGSFDRSAGIWLGEIHPICADNETAWQGHNGNYFARHIVPQSN